MTPYAEAYQAARELLKQEPAGLFRELDRVIGAAQIELGGRFDDAVRLAEMALVAHLASWRLGSPQGAIRQAVARVGDNLHDPLALGLGLRLAAAYARLGRVDDEAHRLASLADRLVGTGLGHPEQAYAEEAAAYLAEALFLPSQRYTYALIKDLAPDAVGELASAQLGRGNPSFAAQLLELAFVRALDPWYLGPPLKNVEAALARYREQRPANLQPLAAHLARAYMQGGFVDLRARDHVLAVLEGEEALLLGEEPAIGLREYVDRDRFEVPDALSYRRAKTLAPEAFRAAVLAHLRHDGLTSAQRLCEMLLVRRYDDWYLGEPTQNVKNAIQRYLDKHMAEGSGDPQVEWAARTLAGFYLATLQGEGHCRRLVRETVARRSSDPDFLAAIEAAGIPGDVTVAELDQLYRDMVEVEARVEAFRAEAEAKGGLSDYERQAYADVLQALEEGEGGLLHDVGRTLGDLVESVAPDALLRSVTATIEDALRLAVGASGTALRRDRILAQLAKKDPSLRTLSRIRDAELELLDQVAASLTLESKLAAALDGLGCGLGGPTLVLIDLPVLVLVNLHAVATVATVYGFDVEEPAERDLVIALTTGGGQALRQLATLELPGPGELELGSSSSDTIGHPGAEEAMGEAVRRHLAGHAALAMHSAAARLAARLVRVKLVQLVPILGGAVGAGVNYHFTQQTCQLAVRAYRLKWLLRKFGA